VAQPRGGGCGRAKVARLEGSHLVRWQAMATALAVVLCVLQYAQYTVAESNVPATDDKVRWTGRTVRSSPQMVEGHVRWSYAGVSASFVAIDSTGFYMQYGSTFKSGSPIVHVYLNGVLHPEIALANDVPPQTWLTIATGLPRADYNVTLMYVTDPITLTWPTLPNYWHEATQFRVDGTFATQAPVSRTQRRIDIYGDSITAGNQINATSCAPDWSGTYGRILCESFHANCTCAAISGKGIYANCCDNNETMDSIGLRALPGDFATMLTAADYSAAGRPDGILINLGTNDWAKVSASKNESGFVVVYTNFVKRLAALHGFPGTNAPIFFLGVGPITHAYGPAIDQVVVDMAKVGIRAVKIDMTTPVDRCGHPPYASHEMMASQARPIMAHALGWD
jgi:hypothetical protein